MTATDRDGYIRGLRELADRLDANPDCPLPYHGRSTPMHLFAHSETELRAAVRAIGGEKVPDEVNGFSLERTFGALRVSTTPLYGACERVEIGTKAETREEVVTPAVTRTVEVEIPVYETRCPESLLKPEQETAA